jgi:DNA-binding transcriptional regulator LsrR (DeoR family)
MKKTTLSDMIYYEIQHHDGIKANTISNSLDIKINSVSSALTQLKHDGMIINIGGLWYIKPLIQTIGDLRKAIEKYPDDKPIIIDDNGDTYGFNISRWDYAPDDDISHPLAIFI